MKSFASSIELPGLLRAIELGNAWSANTVNTAIFRHHGVLTRGRYQFCAFHMDGRRLRLARRDLESGELSRHDLDGEYRLADAHNSISLGIDREGVLHLAYDHHASRLRYRRAKRPLCVQDWGEETPMSGQHEETVTYPAFLVSSGGPLLMLYRDGHADRGTALLKEYSESSAAWIDRETAVLSGAQQQPWTSNAYWNHPAFGPDGELHLAFVWRTHCIGEEQRLNNVDIGYARSPDHGRNWFSTRGQPFRLPITQVNAETAWAVPPGSNLINQSGMAVDVHGRPHVVFYADDPDGVPQYRHLWFDGREWKHSLISARTKPFTLTGSGTLQIPVSRPEIVIDAACRVYVIYRGDLTGDHMAVQRLLPPAYLPDPADIKLLWQEPLGFAEPVIDRLRWAQDGVLSMLIQKNGQPPNDVSAEPAFEPVYLADWDLQAMWMAHGVAASREGSLP
jgi:hypothetical protein